MAFTAKMSKMNKTFNHLKNKSSMKLMMRNQAQNYMKKWLQGKLHNRNRTMAIIQKEIQKGNSFLASNKASFKPVGLTLIWQTQIQ
jgi:hypothetical protein